MGNIIINFLDLIKSTGAEVTTVPAGSTNEKFKVDGDVILINSGLTRIPSGLVEVTGTLDISLNPIESFECDLKNVGRLICMGTKPSSLEMIENIMINGKIIEGENVDEESKYLVKHVQIQDYEPKDICDAYKFNKLRKKLPEIEGII